jgi:hypothetical protein
MGLQYNTVRAIRKNVEEGKTFRLDNIWTTVYKPGEFPQIGRLAPSEVEKLNSDIQGHNGTYVFYSYQTPIGWTSGDGWYIPDEDYSATTKHHKNVLRLAIGS